MTKHLWITGLYWAVVESSSHSTSISQKEWIVFMHAWKLEGFNVSQAARTRLQILSHGWYVVLMDSLNACPLPGQISEGVGV